MHYLDNNKFKLINNSVLLKPISSFSKNQIDNFNFCCKIEEYKSFLLKEALILDKKNISKTFILMDKDKETVIGYFSLATNSIKLDEKIKLKYDVSSIQFLSFPALLIGKLAINEEESKKGYGSYLIDVATNFAFFVNKIGVACRFICVDADIQYDKKTFKFYEKNGFTVVEHKTSNKNTIHMIKDIFEN